MQTVLVTGASSGIGKAYAYAFAKRGDHIILTARRKEVLEQVAEDITKQFHTTCTVIVQDLSDDDAAITLVKEIEKQGLQVDILVNNAGFATKGLLSHSDFAKQQRELAVNIKAVTELTYLLIDKMAERKKGTVINLASAAAFNPVPYNAVYSATKAYVLSFSQSIAYEYKDKGVYVLAVCPQATDTHFFDEFNKMEGRMRQPDDVVRSTFRAMKKRKTICTDGKMCYLQALMPHFLSRKMCVRITGRVGKAVWGNT
ncbi:SDR family NAD(P)-dependent oxidoreductase [Anaerosporobacter faecicola]|uniref:SDR family NAD(P)-dependent oxidoreductase n=1 Tax=Anaerosporobacter faecicola TaxID=2718714 RepID=UPI0014386F71|nr:SDR family oxidoreductase [Anaerosporobacter faecicola]